METSRLNNALRKGCWTQAEDELLKTYVDKFGEGNWKHIPSKSEEEEEEEKNVCDDCSFQFRLAGLNRCPKSCRLRWINYLRPNINRGEFALDEDDLIIRLHRLLGNRWSLIAGRIPGRTANDIKNHWTSYLSKKIVSNDFAEENNQLADHRHTSNICSKPSDGDFESSSGQKQDREDHDNEQDVTLFWKSLLLEGDNLVNMMTVVENKDMKSTDDDKLFQGLEDFLQDFEIDDGCGQIN